MFRWNLFELLLLLLVFKKCLVVTATTNVNRNEKTFKINTDLTQRNSVVATNLGVDNKQFHNASTSAHKFNNNNNQSMEWHANNMTHICTREEMYVEKLKIPTMEPVRVRSSNWCLEFPPRCSTYKTEMREIIKVQDVNKTRTIRFCCDGYEGNISVNDTRCKPVCRGGCGHGHCQSPDICTCEPGYMGKHCTQRCDHDHWGIKCQNECQCRNGAVCDNKSGICHCTSGWTGQFCELPCPVGTFGIMCRQKCECGAVPHCHPQTGVCGDTLSTSHNTQVMIATLNSTIANITQNLDLIAKNIVDNSKLPISALDPNTKGQANVHDVIVIKQDEKKPAQQIYVHNADANADILENLQSSVAKGSEVIHVITGWPTNRHNLTEQQLRIAGVGHKPTTDDLGTQESNAVAQHDTNLLTTLLIILLIIIIAIAGVFLYIYRCNYRQKQHVPTANMSSNTSPNLAVGEDVNDGRHLHQSIFNAMPVLPAFTKMARNKIDGRESCDLSRKNSTLESIPYTYARKESMYSVIEPKSFKSSSDSHLYDEIRYPTFHLHCNDHQHHMKPAHRIQHLHQTHMEIPPQSPHHIQYQHQPEEVNMVEHQNNINDTMTYHTTRVIVPKVNAKYLHVPQISTNFAHV